MDVSGVGVEVKVGCEHCEQVSAEILARKKVRVRISGRDRPAPPNVPTFTCAPFGTVEPLRVGVAWAGVLGVGGLKNRRPWAPGYYIYRISSLPQA